jgi:hypothetical protein
MSYIINESDHRCFLCGKKDDSFLLITEGNEREEFYFCGSCVYYSSDIGRPYSKWISQKEKDRKKRAEQRKKNKARREHREWLKQFCCKKWGGFIWHTYQYNSVNIYKEGTIIFNNYKNDLEEDCDDIDKLNFDYCPYCRKEFIREKIKKKVT